MRKIPFVATLLILLVSMAAQAQSNDKAINLKVYWWGSQTRHERTQQVFDLYRKTHPNVTFEAIFQGFDGYYQKLSIMAASNEMPDIFQFYVGAGDSDQFITKNLLEPLDTFVSKKVINTTTISPSVLSTGKLNGKLYGIPLGINAKAMVVDVEAYKKAGLEIPKDGYASWEALAKDLEKLKKVTGAYGADDILDVNFMMPYYARQVGQVQYAPKTGIGYDEKTYLAYLTMKKDWMDRGLIPTIDVSMMIPNFEQSLLVKGKSAVNIVYTNQLGAYVKAAGRELALIGLPGPNRAKALDVRPGNHFAVSAKSKNKEEAARFISWFVNDVEANRILAADRGMPVSNTVLRSLDDLFTPEQKAAAQYLDKATLASSPMDPAPPAGSSEIEKLQVDLSQKVLFSMITPKDAYKQLREEALKIYSRNLSK